MDGAAVAAVLHHCHKEQQQQVPQSIYAAGTTAGGRRMQMDFQEAEKRMVAGMHEMVVAYFQRKQNYMQLLTFILYFGLYLSILYMQKDNAAGYSMESTIRDYLTPEDPESGAPVTSWSTAEKFGGYIGSQIVSQIFVVLQ
jgi:hypothetical protein